mmetsp:Transcript_21286/g.37626  ORF Transcript_21286/g.37626 Transcript_21286/m.37626 type:complete len:453 (+) Transcript_21286:338-1696(+)
MSSPAKQASSTTSSRANSQCYIHTFGHALAQKLLGASQVNDCIRQAYRLMQQQDGPVSENPCHCFRSSWRSNVRFPWQLPKTSVACGRAGRDDDEEKITPETLFVDITFDFILFPTEIFKEGMTDCCHNVLLKKEDFWGEDTEKEQGGSMMMEECNSIAMAVAIRIGALVAIPSSQCGDGSCSEEKITRHNTNEGGREDGYQYYYQRGDNALTVSDLDEHCRGIDIVLEEMDAADVARIMGDAFLEGCHHAGGPKPWQVMGKSENGRVTATGTSSDSTTIDHLGMAEQTRKHIRWNLKLHHQALEADGCLPLSNNGGSNMGESIGRCMLDMILLQSNDSRDGGVCVSVPKTEALMLWKKINPTLVRAVEKPVLEPSPQKMSPARKDVAVRIPYAEMAAPKEEKDDKAEKSSRPKTATRRPPKPQQTALFARGKKTTLGGSRRKKPKFTLGPA